MTIDPRAALNDLAHSLDADSETNNPSVDNEARSISEDGSNKDKSGATETVVGGSTPPAEAGSTEGAGAASAEGAGAASAEGAGAASAEGAGAASAEGAGAASAEGAEAASAEGAGAASAEQSKDGNTSSTGGPEDPCRIVSLLPSQLSLQIGEVGKLTITIDPVQTKDTVIPITVDQPDLVKISPTVSIPAGKTDQTFYIERLKEGHLSVTAKLNRSVGQATVNIAPAMLLTYSPWYRKWGKTNIPLSSNKTVRNIQCASDSLLGSFLILLILFLAAYFTLQYTDHQATLPIVLLFGALGSFISQQRRLKEMSDEDFELFNFSTIYKWLSPVGGAVLAGILYLMFIGDLLAGDIFPSFLAPKTEGKPPVNGIKVIFEIGSPIPGDYAKLLFWSFVAGYSERFVTDILGRFETQAAQPSQPLVSNEQKPGKVE